MINLPQNPFPKFIDGRNQFGQFDIIQNDAHEKADKLQLETLKVVLEWLESHTHSKNDYTLDTWDFYAVRLYELKAMVAKWI